MQAMSHQQQDSFKFQALAESHDLSFLMCPVGDQIKLAKGIIALKTWAVAQHLPGSGSAGWMFCLESLWEVSWEVSVLAHSFPKITSHSTC